MRVINLLFLSSRRLIQWSFDFLAVSSSSQLQHIRLCICTDLLVDVYIVKGNDNWANNPSQDVAEMFHYAPACCNDFNPISYRVEEEDEYYVIHYQCVDICEGFLIL